MDLYVCTYLICFQTFRKMLPQKNPYDKLQVMLHEDDSNCWLIVVDVTQNKSEHDYKSVNKTY